MPAGQAVHEDWPAAEKLPGAHAVHCAARTPENWPAGQSLQSAVVVPVEYLPATGHGSQPVALGPQAHKYNLS